MDVQEKFATPNPSQLREILTPSDPFTVLNILQTMLTAEPFLDGIDGRMDWRSGLVIARSSVTDAPPSNNGVSNGELSDDDVRRLEGVFRNTKVYPRRPAFSMAVSPQTAGLRQRLLDRGYEVGWTDVYMRAGRSLIDKPSRLLEDTPPTRVWEASSSDLRTLTTIHNNAWLQEWKDRDLTKNQISMERAAARTGILRLLESDRGHVFVVDQEDDREGNNEAGIAVGMITVAISGIVAYIARLAVLPEYQNQRYARVLLETALSKSVEACGVAGLLGVDPIVCFATCPQKVSYFKGLGFDEWFTAQGLVAAA